MASAQASVEERVERVAQLETGIKEDAKRLNDALTLLELAQARAHPRPRSCSHCIQRVNLFYTHPLFVFLSVSLLHLASARVVEKRVSRTKRSE